MRLLFVIDNLGSGGAQRQITLLAAGLADRGHTSEFFTYQPDIAFFESELRRKAIRIYSERKASRFDFGPVKVLRKLLGVQRYDAAVAFMPTPSVYLALASGIRSPVPFFVSHRIAFANRYIPFKYVASLTACSATKAIVANSFQGALQLKNALPLLQHKVQTILNGVDLDLYDPGPPPISESSPRLLFIGRLSPQKNIHRLLEAFALLKERGLPPPMLLWAGRFDEGAEAARYATQIQEALKRLRLEQSWHHLGERTDIPHLLRDCDAVVLPSTFEGTPNAVCEGLAGGRPILASRVGDLEYLVDNGVSGLLFDPLKAENIADQLECFFRMSREQRIEMGRSARRGAEEKLSLKRYINEWEATLANSRG